MNNNENILKLNLIFLKKYLKSNLDKKKSVFFMFKHLKIFYFNNYRKMAFAPKKKTSKSRSRTRTTNWIKLTAKKLKNRVMLNSEATGLAHMVDENWMYKGRVVIEKKSNKKTTRI